MAYIGKTPITGNFVKLDAITVVNGQAGYTMNNGGSAFTDYENVNQFLVSLNGILQAPTDSFTVSGSTLTFASNLATGDVIDFVMVLGNTLDIGTPSDATVTDAKTNFVSTSSAAGLQIKGDGTTDGTLQLNCSQNSHGIKLSSPSHASGQSYELIFPTGNVTADKVLKVASVSGSGATGVGQLSFGDAGGITEADFFFLPSEITSDGTLTSLTRATTGFDKLGTGMTQSSGVFTFPSTGLYEIRFQGEMDSTDGDSFFSIEIDATTDGSNFNEFSRARGGSTDSGGDTRLTTSCSILFDVTNTSTHKVRFELNSLASGTLVGSSAPNYRTHVIFKRLGNT